MWLGPSADAPDTHKLWADDGSPYEAALKASGWGVEVPAPGSDDDDVEPGEVVERPDGSPEPVQVGGFLPADGTETPLPPVEPREISPETQALVASAKPRTTRKNRT